MIVNNVQNAYIHITEYCEHHCQFCYASHGLGNFGHADIERLKRIVLLVADAGIKKLSLVGGDPVLHPMIASLLQFISKQTKMETVLMSNTGRFPHNDISELSSYIDVFMTTIHGDNALQHDAVTMVRGSYDELIETCREYENHKVKVEIAFNITPWTFDKITSSVDALLQKGIHIHRLVLQRIAPVTDKEGNVIKSNIDYIPNAKQVNTALSQMDTMITHYGIPVELVDPFPLCIVEDRYKHLITPCKCGVSDLSINGNGDITRCGADPNYTLGNILVDSPDKTNPITYIWYNSVNLDIFRRKTFLPNVCADCKDKYICGGGCAVCCNVFSINDRNHLDIFALN